MYMYYMFTQEVLWYLRYKYLNYVLSSLLAKAALLLFLLHRMHMQLYSPCTVRCKAMSTLGHVAIVHLLAHS